MLLFAACIVVVSLLAIYFGDGVFIFFANVIGYLSLLALTVAAIGSLVVAMVIVLHTLP